MSDELSPNDPRAVVEDPNTVKEEQVLRVAGRFFIHGLRVAVIALLIVIFVPAEAPGLWRIVRTAAIYISAIALAAAFLLPIGPLVKYYRLRK